MPRLWPKGGLWRHPDFLKLWSAETISQFGSTVDDLAIGFVAIVVLDASAFEVALLGTLNFLPFILFTLPAGVWVDRLRRRPILIAGDFGRAALLATIPIAYVADALTMWQLYIVVFLTGICTVFFDVAYQSYLPSLVERDQIIDGNSKLEISRSAAQLGGPGPRRSARRDPHRPLCRARGRDQLLGLRTLPSRDPKARGSGGTSNRRRSQDEPLDRAQGRAPLCPR